MEQLKAAVEPVNTVPAEFWYACTMILTAVLIWVIQRYFSSLQTTIKEIQVSIRDLTRLVSLHDKQLIDHDKHISDHDTDIRELQKRRTR